MARAFTNQLLEMVDDGILDQGMVLEACLKWMSEDNVREMMFANGFTEDNDDWDEEEDDGQPSSYEEYQDLYGGDDNFYDHAEEF